MPFEPDLPALARWADFLVLSCPGGPATRHLVSAAVLDALGPDGFLINVARGSVVDEAALIRAIETDRIAGAGLMCTPTNRACRPRCWAATTSWSCRI